MRGLELRRFFEGLQHTFADFKLSDSDYSIIRKIEIDVGEKPLGFPEFVSIIGHMAGYRYKSINNKLNSNGDVGNLPVEIQSSFIDKIAALENSLSESRHKYSKLHIEYHKLQKKLLEALENNRVTSIKPKSDAPVLSNTFSYVDKLKSMVKSLLLATQLLSNDRRDLYDQLFSALQGNEPSEMDISKRLKKETEIINLYQKIMNNTDFDADLKYQKDEHAHRSLDKLEKCKNIKSERSDFMALSRNLSVINVIICTVFLWFLGIFICLLVAQLYSFSGVDFLSYLIGILSVPRGSIY